MNLMPLLRPFAIFSAAAALLAQQPPAPEQQEPPEVTFRTGVNVVVAPTTVTDRAGNYVANLQPSDFRLTDNEKGQEIKVDTAYTPISLVIAVQANSQAEPALPAVRKIGALLKPLLVGDQGEVALVAFDHRIQVLQDFTSNFDQLEQAFQSLKAGSTSSRMTDAVEQAARMLRKRPPDHRRVLLLISETREMGSAAKPKQALTDLQFDNIMVYSVNMNRFKNTLLAKPQPPRPDPFPPGARAQAPGVPNTPTYTNQSYSNATNSANFIPVIIEIFRATKAIFVDNPVEVYTKWTGGREYAFADQKALERALSDIGEELHAQYIISYVPNNRDEGGFHDIKVTVESKANGNVKVRTRPGYWVAAQPK